jgi:hypothetical protein
LNRINLKISPTKAILLLNERIGEIKMMTGKQDKPGYYNFLGDVQRPMR